MEVRKIPRRAPKRGEGWRLHFREAMVSSGLAPLTIRTYESGIDLFATWFRNQNGEDLSLEALRAVDLQKYRHHLVEEAGLAAATVNHRLQALRRLCRWGRGEDVLEDDPAEGLHLLRARRRRRPVGLLEQEAHALLRAAGSSRRSQASRNYAVVQLLLQTGLRLSEAAALVIADLTVHQRSGCVRVRYGKGLKGREVPLNASARRALRIHLDARPGNGAGPLFLSQRGRAMSPRALQKLIATLARRANITRLQVSPHTLRHTFALTYLKANPGKLVELSNLLGHDSIETTAIYTQPSAEELAEGLENSPLNAYG